MPSGSPPLRERYMADLRSGSFPVLVTAVVIATAIGLGLAVRIHEYETGFLLVILLGVQVPAAHERFRRQDAGWLRDVAWTVGASVGALALFGAGYVLAALVLRDTLVVAAVAFVAANVVGWLALTGLERLS